MNFVSKPPSSPAQADFVSKLRPLSSSSSSPAEQTNEFRKFWDLGYRRLIPVLPPNADLSEKSFHAKLVGTKRDVRGKAPGKRGVDGKWYGLKDWLNVVATEADLDLWHSWGANVGLLMGHDGVHMIDADALDPSQATSIQTEVFKCAGVIPTRVGAWPKMGYLVRVSGDPMSHRKVEYGDKGELVEFLGVGRQAVVAGIHPKKKEPYTWTIPLVPLDQLPIVSPQVIEELRVTLRAMLPNARIVTESAGAGEAVSQASLRGDPEKVRKAVTATPNTTAVFPTRKEYIEYGYAIKAALPDHPREAFEIFSEWSERWADPPAESEPNTPASISKEWAGMKPPYRRGANWIYELAEQHSDGAFKKVDAFFDVILEPHRATDQDGTSYTLEPSPYTFPDPASIPRRQWLYGDHYIRGFVSATVAPGGVGKSSLTIVEALAMASGKPLLGVEPKGQFRVWLWNGEDPRDELNRRVAAAISHYGLSAADIGDRLLVDTGHEQELVLATETRNGAAISEDVSAAIVSALQRDKIDVLVIDPFVSSHRVGENANGAMDLIVKRLGKIAATAGAAIEVVHHVRKTNGAEVTVEDARGGSAFIDAVRAGRALTRMTPQDGRVLGIEAYWRYFRFGGVTKPNMAPSSASPVASAGWFTLVSTQLGNGPGEGLEALMEGDAVGVVIKAEAEDMTEAQNPGQAAEALRLIAEGDWRADVRAGDAWVGYAIARAYELDATDKNDKTQINGILKRLRQDGSVYDEACRDRARHVRQFVRVAKRHTAAASAAPGSIFD